MKPLGMKRSKDKTGGKHHNWWEDVCQPNKQLEKRIVNQEIEKEISVYESLTDINCFYDGELCSCCVDEEQDGCTSCEDSLCPSCNNKYNFNKPKGV